MGINWNTVAKVYCWIVAADRIIDWHRGRARYWPVVPLGEGITDTTDTLRTKGAAHGRRRMRRTHSWTTTTEME